MTPRTSTLARQVVAVLARAVRPYVDSERGPTRAALEIARNAAQVLLVTPSEDARAIVETMLRYRLGRGWIACDDVQGAAAAAGRAWLQIAGLGVAA